MPAIIFAIQNRWVLFTAPVPDDGTKVKARRWNWYVDAADFPIGLANEHFVGSNYPENFSYL